MAAGCGYDALVVVSFGGPEGPQQVGPFLDNVLRGRNVPPERRDQVAEHYYRFGGRSPLNDHNRALVTAVAADFKAHRLDLPVYWGNRNWHPMLADTVRRMGDDGVQRALAFVTSAYASYSGCHQYLDDIAHARAAVGGQAPVIDKLRVFYNHPGFVQANADALRSALDAAGARARVVFTAHSIPQSMAATCDYQQQLLETARLVISHAAPDAAPEWSLAFQSRSGPPTQPWLEPDIADQLRALAGQGTGPVVVAPIGFVSDHMEVVFDLDTEAQQLAAGLGLRMVRAATAGVHPAFVTMVRQLVTERLDPSAPKAALGGRGPYHDTCRAECCP
ncbi:MAG: ferrochelatase, partial [Actinomycetota bacterium]|nr:ferrochelatase [Actinomycetota bacterium]